MQSLIKPLSVSLPLFMHLPRFKLCVKWFNSVKRFSLHTRQRLPLSIFLSENNSLFCCSTKDRNRSFSDSKTSFLSYTCAIVCFFLSRHLCADILFLSFRDSCLVSLPSNFLSYSSMRSTRFVFLCFIISSIESRSASVFDLEPSSSSTSSFFLRLLF
jgi:hypothetical protein